MSEKPTLALLPLDENGRINDGALNHDLNCLEWLDLICGQGDRNPSNLFTQYDATGKMTGLVGIDNDSSFGEFVDENAVRSEGKVQRLAYRGIPKNVVSEEMAEKIKSLYTNKDKFEEVLRAME